MSDLDRFYGFALPRRIQVRIAELSFGFHTSRTHQILARIYEYADTAEDIFWAVRSRSWIRAIQRLDDHASLNLVIKLTGDEKMRTLAIWLRGRCGGTLGATQISCFADAPSFQVRKEVARALKRLSAWSALNWMADHDASSRIRRMAECRPARPAAIRIARYTDHCRSLDAPSEPPPLYVNERVDLQDGKPPKPITLIRFLLHRIRRLVHGKNAPAATPND